MLHACMCLIVVMLEDLTVLVNDTWCVLPATWLLSKKLMISVLVWVDVLCLAHLAICAVQCKNQKGQIVLKSVMST